MPDAFNVANRELIIALAARYRVPAIYYRRLFPELGGLIAYGADCVEQVSRGGRVYRPHLQGREAYRPPDPSPREFELMINLTTAKALSLTVQQALLVAADKVIE